MGIGKKTFREFFAPISFTDRKRRRKVSNEGRNQRKTVSVVKTEEIYTVKFRPFENATTNNKSVKLKLF